MILKTKRWINETTRKHPRLRQLLLKLAMKLGVQPVSYSMQLQALEQKSAGDIQFLSGKRRYLTGKKPSISRYLALIEMAKKKYKS